MRKQPRNLLAREIAASCLLSTNFIRPQRLQATAAFCPIQNRNKLDQDTYLVTARALTVIFPTGNVIGLLYLKVLCSP